MSLERRSITCALCARLGFATLAALAADHAYTEGPVVNVGRIGTVDGHFEQIELK